MTKIEIINEAIKLSGLESKGADVILSIIRKDNRNDDIKLIKEIVTKYYQYIIYKNIENIGRTSTFIADSNKRKSFDSFVFAKMYNREFPLEGNEFLKKMIGSHEFFDFVSKARKIINTVEKRKKQMK